MSATLADIRAGLKSNLEAIAGLRAHDVFPAAVATPLATVVADPAIFMEPSAFGNGWTYHFEVRVYVTTDGGIDRAQRALDAYCDPTGDSSVIAAIERAGVVTAGVSAANVERIEGYNEYQVSNASYMRVAFKVKVLGG